MPRNLFRIAQADFNRLGWALVISIAIHLLIIATYHTGKHLRWWQSWRTPAWVQSAKMLNQLFKREDKAKAKPEDHVPLVFVEVNPMAATAEPPPDAKFYSDKNAQAANPEADQELDLPKITGTQDKVAKTEDVPREQFKPLQPTPPRAQAAPQEQPQVKAQSTQAPGDLALAKPDPSPRRDEGKAPRPRPRTVQEALARKSPSPMRVPGEKMRQEGGVQRRSEYASLDTKATLYGAYDAALIEAISQRWYSLLDERDYASDSGGKVVLRFELHYDGRVTAMDVAENTAGEMLGLLCQKAVLDPAPFAAWPIEMRRVLGEVRKIQFTFYYD